MDCKHSLLLSCNLRLSASLVVSLAKEYIQWIHCVTDVCAQLLFCWVIIKISTHPYYIINVDWFNCPYVGQPDDQIGWAISMPFASIYCTTLAQGPILKNFAKKNLRFGVVENVSFFASTILIFFFKTKISLLHLHENQSTFIILMITLVYSKRVSVCIYLLHSAV